MIVNKLQEKVNMTSLEEGIADYILENPKCILNTTAKELANEIYTSPSTIVRFCKKLGFSGFPDFQQNYIREFCSKEHFTEQSIFQNFAFDKTPSVITSLYQYVINETNYRLDMEELRKIASLMNKANKIDFYGNDGNYFLIEKMCHLLNCLYIPAQGFNELNQNYLRDLPKNHSLVFLISHSGTNQTMIRAAKLLKAKNITTVAITTPNHNSLSKLCDYCLYVFADNEHSRVGSMQWMISVGYILDLLYVALISYSKKNI